MSPDSSLLPFYPLLLSGQWEEQMGGGSRACRYEEDSRCRVAGRQTGGRDARDEGKKDAHCMEMHACKYKTQTPDQFDESILRTGSTSIKRATQCFHGGGL